MLRTLITLPDTEIEKNGLCGSARRIPFSSVPILSVSVLASVSVSGSMNAPLLTGYFWSALLVRIPESATSRPSHTMRTHWFRENLMQTIRLHWLRFYCWLVESADSSGETKSVTCRSGVTIMSQHVTMLHHDIVLTCHTGFQCLPLEKFPYFTGFLSTPAFLWPLEHFVSSRLKNKTAGFKSHKHCNNGNSS